jgi:uncharacterized protein
VKKEERLKSIIQKMESMLIAFSGGVDSSYLLSIARKVLGKEKVLAVTASSQTYTKSELKIAKAIAKILDANLKIIQTYEMDNPRFYKNPLNRCYWCKRELFSHLKSIAEKGKFRFIADGSNLDDIKDYRPGSIASKEFGIRHPLLEAGLGKKDIRSLAKKSKLPNWNAPSMACLASRFPFGTPISGKDLKMIEKAEKYIRELGYKTVRVRKHNNLARIEVAMPDIKNIVKQPAHSNITKYLKKLGFRFITLDLEGYRTGSLNPKTEQL